MYNLDINYNINNKQSISVAGNYYDKTDVTNDQYLGDNYWSYGDSVANAEAGVYWEREGHDYGRFELPSNIQMMTWSFQGVDYPWINHKKSEQDKYNITGTFKWKLQNHLY